MARCDLCKQFDDCPFRYDLDAQCSEFKQKPMTNGDKIRSMSDEELAERFYMFLCVHFLDDKVECKDDGCRKCWMKWLREEAEDD